MAEHINEPVWQVAIFGTFDVENYGDLLFPIIAEAELTQRLGSVNLHRFSYNAKTQPEWPYTVTSLTELPRIAGSLDGVLIGGGFVIRFDKFVAHGYGPTTHDIHHPTGYWLTPALIALQHAVPVMWNAPGMHCNSIPVWARPLLTMALEQSQYVRVRDALSRDALGALTHQAEIEVLPDTAFGLPRLIDEQQPSSEFTRLREQAGLTGPYIVIHAIQGLESYLQMFQDHPESFRQYRFLVVPIGPVLGDDPSIIARFLPDAITLSFWPQPLLMAEILSQAQAVIGHSYHLAISALAFGVPVFCSADLTAGKYTALAEFDSLHALPDVATVDPQWFLARVGKTSPSLAARAAADKLVEHWDRVATIISQGKTSSQPALGAFLQNLPNLFEATVEACDTRALELQNSNSLQELAQQQRIFQLNEQLALSDARVLELQNSNSLQELAQQQRIFQLNEQLALSDARVLELKNSNSLQELAQQQRIFQLNEQLALSDARVLELQNSNSLQELAQQQLIFQLNEQLALSDARVLELQNSNSFRITAPLRSITRGIRNLTEKKNR